MLVFNSCYCTYWLHPRLEDWVLYIFSVINLSFYAINKVYASYECLKLENSSTEWCVWCVGCFSCNQLVNAELCLDVLDTIYRTVIYSSSLSICYSPGSVPSYLLVTAQWGKLRLRSGGKELGYLIHCFILIPIQMCDSKQHCFHANIKGSYFGLSDLWRISHG